MSQVVVFPGQGSQSIGMLADLVERLPALSERLQQGSAILGYDLRDIIYNGPEEKLNQTHITQPAVLIVSMGLWDALPSQRKSSFFALTGHSLGEYTAMVAAGVITFEDAVKLVSLRGQFMQEAVAGLDTAMAAVLGLDDQAVIDTCAEVANNQCVDPVNFNCPGQVVIAGHSEAVDRAIVALKARGAKRAVRLAVSVPAHSALMKPAARRLQEFMKTVEFRQPVTPVLQNVSAERESDPLIIRENLLRQLYSPVQWTQTIRNLQALGVSQYLECGPGKILSGLIRKIDKNSHVDALSEAAFWAAAEK
jgi:[acyl-carrier-protein] S-malonyltransferase